MKTKKLKQSCKHTVNTKIENVARFVERLKFLIKEYEFSRAKVSYILLYPIFCK